MSQEQRILSAVLHDREAYDNIKDIIDAEDDFSDVGAIVVQRIQNYYDHDDTAEYIDKAYILDQLRDEFPKQFDTFDRLIDRLEPVSIPNVVYEFRRLKIQRCKQRLAQALLGTDEEEQDKWMDKLQAYHQLEAADDDGDVFIDLDLEDVLNAYEGENLITMHPSSLNQRIGGGLIPGTQVAIYAPTEVGKTMVSMAQVCHWLRNGHRVLYVGNEDPAKAMIQRIYSNLSNMDRNAMLANPHRAKMLAQENGFSNLVFYEAAPGSIYDIQKKIEKFEPEIVVVDQMANMETKGNFSKVEKNEVLAARLRAVAKKLGIIMVIVHQASDSAHMKLILEKNDMYYSNVGVQGQMDVMIGIGMDDSYHNNNQRMLTLTKNKLNNDHTSWPVSVNPLVSNIYDIGD